MNRCFRILRVCALASGISAATLGHSSLAGDYARLLVEITYIKHPVPLVRQELPPPQERPLTYHADVITGRGGWSIQLTNYYANGDDSYFSDGSQVYRWLRMTKPTGLPQTRGSPEAFNLSMDNHVQVEITPGQHPLGHLGINIPWLVYCSGFYLESPGRRIPLPCRTIRSSPSAFIAADTTHVFEDSLRLPSFIELRTDKAQRKIGLDDPRAHRSRGAQYHGEEWQGKAADGMVVFRYRALEVTNFAGMVLPTRFEMEEFRQHSSTSLEPSVSVSGRVTRITSAEATLKEPVYVATNYGFVDRRFRHDKRLVSAIRYDRTNYSILSTNDAELLDLYSAAVKKAPLALSKVTGKWWQIIMYSVLIVPVAGLVYLRIMGHRRQKTTDEKRAD